MLFLAALSTAVIPEARTAAIEFLGDHPELITASQQDWGELGLNRAAHAPGQVGTPLQIGEKHYATGVGHHANGTIKLSLEGDYSNFDAEVGVQAQPGGGGSVRFLVRVDDAIRFDSGVMHQSDQARACHIPLGDARELTLETQDGGDGITNDVADWAEARLTRVSTLSEAEPPVNMAPSARVVTWDPGRKDGVRANRIQEFPAQDLFLETDVVPSSSGSYEVPIGTNGSACIGLQWLSERLVKDLGVGFAPPESRPDPASVRVEGWFGESAWQGSWRELAGDMTNDHDRLIFTPRMVDEKGNRLLTRKVRLVFATDGKPVAVRDWVVHTLGRWRSVDLILEAEPGAREQHGTVAVRNGELVRASGPPIDPQAKTRDWLLRETLRLQVRSSVPSLVVSDPTVLEFRLPKGNVSVAVADVMERGCVYVSDLGLFVTREPKRVSLQTYRQEIQGRKTVLERVREMPEQTLAQAMEHTHHSFQDSGPVLLSLACDNTKFMVEREGTIRFQPNAPQEAGDWFASAGVVQPHFGIGERTTFHRQLDGGWLPIPVIQSDDGGVLYTERVFVAPDGEPPSKHAKINQPSICVAEFTIHNGSPRPTRVSLGLRLSTSPRAAKPVVLRPVERGFLADEASGSFAFLETNRLSGLEPTIKGNEFVLKGELEQGQTARCILYLPGQDCPRETIGAPRNFDHLRNATGAYWEDELSQGATIEVPDPWLADLVRSSRVRCLVDARNEADGKRVAAWIAAISYGPLESEAHSVIRGMDLMGHQDFAQRALDYFIHRYNPEGFLTTGYTTFGTAWHLWTLGEHYQWARDTAWMKEIAPEVARLGRWIVRQTEKTRRLDASGNPVPEYGLMPPGVLADWNAFAYHYTMNAYYCAALREAGIALENIGDPHGTLFQDQARELARQTRRAYLWTQAQSPALPLSNGRWIPAYPSQVHSPGPLAQFFPGQDAGRSWCYDVEVGAHQLVAAGVLEPNERETSRMLDHMEDVQFLSDGWFDYPAAANSNDWYNLGGFSKVQPYYTRNAEIYALRGDVKPFIRSYFNTIAAMVNPEVLTFWEHFHHSGAWDKTHETGYFLQQTRFMLVLERGPDLWLAPLVPREWLRSGGRIQVGNAPTRFGPVSYSIMPQTDRNLITANVHLPSRNPPRAVVVRLPHPDGRLLRSVLINGRSSSNFDAAQETVTIPTQPVDIQIEAHY